MIYANQIHRGLMYTELWLKKKCTGSYRKSQSSLIAHLLLGRNLHAVQDVIRRLGEHEVEEGN